MQSRKIHLTKLHIDTVIRATRPPFLVLTPVCVFLGVASAMQTPIPVQSLDILLVLIMALAAHIGVNALNEYQDFKSGLDATTSRTAFSGGSGALVENPDARRQVFFTAAAAIGLTVLLGLYYLYRIGVPALPIGVTGLALVLAYTSWISRHAMIGLIAPGLGFGPLMVTGTHLALTDSYSPLSVLVSLVPFFLVNNLLLLNQFPDIGPDRKVGRRNIPIVLGTSVSTAIYGLFVAAASSVIIYGVMRGYLPASSLLALVPLAAAFVMLPAISKNAADIHKLSRYLGFNVAVTLLTPLILGITLVWA